MDFDYFWSGCICFRKEKRVKLIGFPSKVSGAVQKTCCRCPYWLKMACFFTRLHIAITSSIVQYLPHWWILCLDFCNCLALPVHSRHLKRRTDRIWQSKVCTDVRGFWRFYLFLMSTLTTMIYCGSWSNHQRSLILHSKLASEMIVMLFLSWSSSQSNDIKFCRDLKYLNLNDTDQWGRNLVCDILESRMKLALLSTLEHLSSNLLSPMVYPSLVSLLIFIVLICPKELRPWKR